MGHCQSCHSDAHCHACHSDAHKNDFIEVEAIASWIAPQTFTVGDSTLTVNEARFADFPPKHQIDLDDMHISNVALTCELFTEVPREEERQEACFNVNNMCGPRPGRVNKATKMIKLEMRVILNMTRRNGHVTVDVDDVNVLGKHSKWISEEKFQSDLVSVLEDRLVGKIDEHKGGKGAQVEVMPVMSDYAEHEGIFSVPKPNVPKAKHEKVEGIFSVPNHIRPKAGTHEKADFMQKGISAMKQEISAPGMPGPNNSAAKKVLV